MSTAVKLFIFSINALLPVGVFSVSPCVLSIVRCCDPGNQFLPFRCFEVNNCPGLIWAGERACSGKTVAAAIKAVSPPSFRVGIPPLEARILQNNSVTIEISKLRIPNCHNIEARSKNVILGCNKYIRPVEENTGQFYLEYSDEIDVSGINFPSETLKRNL